MSDQEPTEDGDAGWYSNDAATFGDRLAAGREAVGMTQAVLARRLGVKLGTLQNWENDLSEPRANKLQMVAGLLNVSLMWLLTGEGDGLDAPDAITEAQPGLADIKAEVSAMRLEALRTARRLGQLEKRLRLVMQQTS